MIDWSLEGPSTWHEPMEHNLSDELNSEQTRAQDLGEGSFSVSSALIFYALMGGFALVASVLLGVFDTAWFDYQQMDLILGISGASLYIISSQLYFKFSASARALKKEMVRLLGRLTPVQILMLTLGSAIGEELLFRGWLQSHFGLVLTSIGFGACHGGFIGRFLPWSIASTFAGLMFGGMMDVTGSLWGPILAHGVVNGVGLTLMRLEHE